MATEVLTLNGLTLTAERPARATRPPVLFLHGILGGAWYFDWYQRFFAERGYPAYALNLRGHHGSRPVDDLGGVSMQDYVDDALEAAHWLARAGDDGAAVRPVVVGHSMGGLLAQKVAEADAASAVVLMCAVPPKGIYPVRTAQFFLRQFKYLPALLRSRPLAASRGDAAALFFNALPPAERAAAYARLVPESGRALREIAFGAVTVDASRVRCPVLSVVASHDQAMAPSIGYKLARRYDGPVREYYNHAHFIVREPGWEGPAAEIEHWIDGRLRLGGHPAPGIIHLRHLARRKGAVIRLRFDDGHAIVARLIAIDFEAPAELIYEVLALIHVGPSHLSPVHPGMVAAMNLERVVELEEMADGDGRMG
jgi:non-heme chloroperoxidase